MDKLFKQLSNGAIAFLWIGFILKWIEYENWFVLSLIGVVLVFVADYLHKTFYKYTGNDVLSYVLIAFVFFMIALILGVLLAVSNWIGIVFSITISLGVSFIFR